MLLVGFGMHVLEKLLRRFVFKDWMSVFMVVGGMFFAEWSAKPTASGLIKKSAFAANTRGTTDNAAMLIDFSPL